MSILFKIIEHIKDSVYLSPTFPIRQKIVAWRGKEFLLELEGAAKFYVRPHSSDASTLRQIFRDREYDISRFPQWSAVQTTYSSIMIRNRVPIIVDAGANVGAAAVWFAQLFPGATIVAAEPDPLNAAQCRRNTVGLPNVRVLECAIGAKEGRVSLSNPTDEAWAVQTNRIASEQSGVSVNTISNIISSVVNGELFIVKIDIEGFESDLFSANFDWAASATVIYIEPHDWMPSTRKTSRNFQQALAPLSKELLVSGENLVYVNCDM